MVAYKGGRCMRKWLVTRDGEPGIVMFRRKPLTKLQSLKRREICGTGDEILIEVLGSAYERLGDGSLAVTDEIRKL